MYWAQLYNLFVQIICRKWSKNIYSFFYAPIIPEVEEKSNVNEYYYISVLYMYNYFYGDNIDGLKKVEEDSLS